MLSEQMRDMVTPPFPEGTNLIGVGKSTVLTWADEVAELEAQVAKLRELAEDTHYCERLEHGVACWVCEIVDA